MITVGMARSSATGVTMACNMVRHQISRKFDVPLSDLVVRECKEKAGPVITDNGNIVMDWLYKFNEAKGNHVDWEDMSDKLKLIPGIIETGIFANKINAAYFGLEDGTVVRRTI